MNCLCHGSVSIFSAPMEVLADRQFRAAMSVVGGMDEMVMEFIRVPDEGHAPSLAKRYIHDEVDPIPIAPQVQSSLSSMLVQKTGLMSFLPFLGT